MRDAPNTSTDDAAAQERLARMEIQLAAAQQLTHVGSWEWDLTTERIIWSDELYRTYGLQPAQFPITYEYWREHLHPEDRERVEGLLKAAFDTCERTSGEYRVIRADGEVRLMHTIGQVICDEKGRPIRVFGATQDVTAARAAETIAKEAMLRLRQIFENVDDVFWMREVETGKMLYVSPAYERVWGATAESLLQDGDSWRNFVHPEDRRAVEEVHEKDADQHDHIYRILRPDGAVRWIRDRAFKIKSAEGAIVRLAGVASDITDIKQAEEALHESRDQLRRLSQRLLEVQESERRHLARELHDEVGQVLTAAKISLQAAQQSAPAAGLAADLGKSVGALDYLLQQVRRMSLDLRPPMLDDFGLLPALRWYVEQTAERSALVVRLTAPEDLPRLDARIETACFRVVQEALTNVVRHAKARTVEVELTVDHALTVTIWDDGAGFDLRAAEAKARCGAAAGLAGMLERVALLEGAIGIDSAPGSGTRVRASFPLPGGTA